VSAVSGPGSNLEGLEVVLHRQTFLQEPTGEERRAHQEAIYLLSGERTQKISLEIVKSSNSSCFNFVRARKTYLGRYKF
jgi:hypothetical protein